MPISRDVCEISNELEFNLYNIEAGQIIKNSTLPIVHEANPRDLIELNVSLTRNIAELNSRVEDYTKRLVENTERLGGKIYGGSSLLCDISSVEPRRYRTTSLSETCGRGLLDITSQQVVLGVNDESLGFKLYNFFKNVNPVFLALTASSPYKYKDGNLEDTSYVSRRVNQYEQLCKYFPETMWRDMSELHSIDEYTKVLQSISNEVNRRLYNNLLDANWEELTKVRNNGKGKFSYVPFDIIEPHQVYWNIRVRPDHRNIEKGGYSLFSLELRIPDMPTTIQRIQMLNSFIVGLAYYIADYDSDNLSRPFNGNYNDLQITSKYGLETKINSTSITHTIENLRDFATRGLEERGYSSESSRFQEILGEVLKYGNDSDLIRRLDTKSADGLRTYLINRLRSGE